MFSALTKNSTSYALRLLAASVLGHSLGFLGHAVLGQLAGQQQKDGTCNGLPSKMGGKSYKII